MKKIDFVQFVIVVMAVCVAMYGCTQIKAVLSENPELIVKIGDAAADILKIIGSEVVKIAMKGDTGDETLYRYEGNRLKTPDGKSVVYFMVRNGKISGIGSK